jgi:hypothetical protein
MYMHPSVPVSTAEVVSTVGLRGCLVTSKFQKFYKILCHIKSLDVYMEY